MDFHDIKTEPSPQGRRFAQANIFEMLENSQIEQLWNYNVTLENCDISEIEASHIRHRRHALGHLFEFAEPSVTFHSCAFNQEAEDCTSSSCDSSTELISPDRESLSSRSHSESGSDNDVMTDEVVLDDVMMEIDQPEQFWQPRRRRVALADIFDGGAGITSKEQRLRNNV